MKGKGGWQNLIANSTTWILSLFSVEGNITYHFNNFKSPNMNTDFPEETG